MENVLKEVTVPCERIPAIDGNHFPKNINVSPVNRCPLNNRILTRYEIAGTLSHIKAINHLKDCPGEYFLVCEDDVVFHHEKYFGWDLKKIIDDAPPFDILKIHNSTYDRLPEMYTQSSIHISSQVCYVVTKQGVEKITKQCRYIDDDTFVFDTDVPLAQADNFIDRLCTSYVYRYNFAGTDCTIDSTLHHSNDKNGRAETNQINFILEDIVNEAVQ